MPYRDVAAEQKIADLLSDLDDVQNDLSEVKEENNRLRSNRLGSFLENVSSPFWWGVLFLTVVVSVCTFKVMNSDGKIDYCYVDAPGKGNEQRTLFGHRPWRPDASLRSLPSAEDPAPLFALAKELGCPIR